MNEESLKELLNEMSVKEKINQMSQISGNFFLDNSAMTGPMRARGFTEENIMLAGSVLGISSAKDMITIQSEYLKKHPHNIPLLFMLDVINGYQTIFPIPLGQGASFDPELVKRCAQVAAKETAADGIHVTFAPMADLVRDARWGRVMESTGEDAWLNGLYAAAMTEGFQGESLSKQEGIAACVKHFAGYGAPTAGRDYNIVELSDHTLKEFYLPAYKAAIDAGSALVMTAFNTVNGIPATGNKKLLREILRTEMGFDGVLISDWMSVEEMVAHGYCENRREAAERAVKSGVDIDMMSGIYSGELEELLADGRITEAEIDKSVMRILKLKNRLGLFEDPFRGVKTDSVQITVPCRNHREIAREAAIKSFVLLKNEEVLPLNSRQRVAFIGPYTDEKAIEGAWSLFCDREQHITIREAAEDVFEDAVYYQGCLLEDGMAFVDKEDMIQAAKHADVVVMPLGEHRLQSGEAASRGEISVPYQQMELFRKIYEVNKNIVVLLFCGRPLDIREIAVKAKAILTVWMPGTEGGAAIIDVLTGSAYPSGKLSMSFPYSVGQVPISYNGYATGRPYRPEDLDKKYVSKYLDIPNEPLYPFGYGLSYTQFEISPICLEQKVLHQGESIKASVIVKNIGNVAGAEVVQLYIRDIAASVVRPIKELKGFKRVLLEPLESQEIVFLLTEDMLRFYTENDRYESESGQFFIWIGNSSSTDNQTDFFLVKT